MSTFIEVQNRVNADFLNRNFGAETRRAIQAAVRHYERQRWDFNETSTALTTSAGVGFVSVPSNFLILDDLRITISGENLPLTERDPDYIRTMNISQARAEPTDYAIYQRRIELALIPDSAYSIQTYYIKSLPQLSADTDENAWLQGGMQDVIAYHASKLMWATILRNDREAAKYQALEQTALTQITGFHEQYRKPGKLKPTSF